MEAVVLKLSVLVATVVVVETVEVLLIMAAVMKWKAIYLRINPMLLPWLL